jgi:hypothetical protein
MLTVIMNGIITGEFYFRLFQIQYFKVTKDIFSLKHEQYEQRENERSTKTEESVTLSYSFK